MADISPATQTILTCFPKTVVKQIVEKTIPTLKIDYSAIEQGYFYTTVYSRITALKPEEYAEFFNIIRKINTVSRFKENGRFINDMIKEAGKEIDKARDLGANIEIKATVAWVYCNMPGLWKLLDKRSATQEVANFHVQSQWYGEIKPRYTSAAGEKWFKQEVKDLLKKSQPIKHVRIDNDKGIDVTRYVIHIDPYPGKIPTFDEEQEDEDELKMTYDVEAEPFQIVDFHEAHKITIKCKFRREQTAKIIEYFLRYIIQAEPIAKPISEFAIARFNAPSFTWNLSNDPDIISVRNRGIRFIVTQDDGLIEEIGHVRSAGDILEYIEENYSSDDRRRELREILEFQADVTYYSGRRPRYMTEDIFDGVEDNRKHKTALVTIKPTGRSIKGCSQADRKKLERFLDNNGLQDLNDVKK